MRLSGGHGGRFDGPVLAVATVLALAAGCSDEASPSGGDAARPDGSAPDGGTVDGGGDAAMDGSGRPPDAGPDGAASDAGALDGAIDAGVDGGGSPDGGLPDAAIDAAVPGCEALDCGDHGTCIDDPSGAYCDCDTGWGGTTCAWCASGYHYDFDSGECVEDVPCPAGYCNLHGFCSDTTGVPVCFCDSGYDGDTCTECLSTHYKLPNGACAPRESCDEDNPCLHPEQCDDTTGAALCDCGEAYTGETCGECAPGYHFEAGQVCVADTECLSTTCAGKGSCFVSGPDQVSCYCDYEYTGDHCTECEDGYMWYEGACYTCGELYLPFDDLYGHVGSATCAIASAGDSPLHYRGVDIHNDYSDDYPGIGECHPDQGPFTTEFLQLRIDGGHPPYLVFDQPIASLSFAYGGVSEEATLEVIADGTTVATLEPPLDAPATVDLDFDTPVTTVVLAVAQSHYLLGLDDMRYLPAICAQ